MKSLIAIALAVLFCGIAYGADHAHKSPHGGWVEDFGDTYHLELRLYKTGNVSFYFLDGNLNPASVPNIKGRSYFQYSKKKVGLRILPADQEEKKNDEFQTSRALTGAEKEFQFAVIRFKLYEKNYEVLFRNPDVAVNSESDSASDFLYRYGKKTVKLPKKVLNLFSSAQNKAYYKERNPLLWLSPVLPGIAHFRKGNKAAGVALGAAGITGLSFIGSSIKNNDTGLLLSGAILWGTSTLIDVLGISGASKGGSLATF